MKMQWQYRKEKTLKFQFFAIIAISLHGLIHFVEIDQWTEQLAKQ